MNNDLSNKKLEKHLKISVFLTIIIGLLFVFSVCMITTIPVDPLFGGLAALPFWFLAIGCVIALYIIWIIYSDEYRKVMVEKKHKDLPFRILLFIGIAVMGLWYFISIFSTL